MTELTDRARIRALLSDHAPGRPPMTKPHITRIETDPVTIVVNDPAIEDATLYADTAETLQRLEQLTGDPATPGRATLTMPLGRLMDADGTVTVLGEAVVEVELIPADVLAQAAGELRQFGKPPVSCWVSTRLTEDGQRAIRRLAALLDGGM